VRVEGWIFEGNLPAIVELVASALGYVWDDLDDAAMAHGKTDTDLEADRWFEYPVVPPAHVGPSALLALGHDNGGSVVFARIDVGDPDEQLATHLETLLGICASCSVTRRES
jgi:hypothetical protein